MLSSSNLIIEHTSSNLVFSQQISANVLPLKSSINQRDLSVLCLGSHVAEPLQEVPWAIREEIFIISLSFAREQMVFFRSCFHNGITNLSFLIKLADIKHTIPLHSKLSSLGNWMLPCWHIIL